jgi:hypothetical protein
MKTSGVTDSSLDTLTGPDYVISFGLLNHAVMST